MMTDHNSNNIQLTVESAKSQDFFQDNNQLEKKYTTKRIKSRSFLSNIAYVDISKGNFYKIFFFFFLMFICLWQRTWIHSLWTENLLIRSMKWSTCSGKTACGRNSTSTSVRRKNFFTLMVRMFYSQKCLKP